ncbi:hypothetical protein MYX77_08140 [Acidobacteriia bacterium AH_259_A11_L15]|nr:hypothetical protein [Acidobacteriia bacterium AH_259_A11_L15]
MRLIKTYEVQIKDKPVAGESPFRKVKETFSTGEAFVDRSLDILPQCIHGHTIHTPQELGGQCVVCASYLCKECATLRCSFDGNLVCRKHALIEGDKLMCGNHNFFRMVFFSLFKG